MCEVKRYHIMKELVTLDNMIQSYQKIAGKGGKKVIDSIEARMDELLHMYSDHEDELIVTI